MMEVTAEPTRIPDVNSGDAASHSEGEEFASSFDTMRLDTTPGVQNGPIYHMPNELLSKILSDLGDVPDLSSARLVNRSFNDVVITDPHLAQRYRLVTRTVPRLTREGHPGSPDQLFDRSMLAEKTAHQLRSEGALDPKHLDFHQAMRKLEPHYPFLPRPGEVPAHPSYNEATRPVTSGDIGAIVDAVFNQPRNPANKETLSEIFGYLSAAQKTMSLMVCHPIK